MLDESLLKLQEIHRMESENEMRWRKIGQRLTRLELELDRRDGSAARETPGASTGPRT